MSFGQRIKDFRKDKGLTQEQLGQLLELTTGTIRNYENDRSKPSGDRMYVLLASMMGVNDLWLQDGEGPMYPEQAEHPLNVPREIPPEKVVGIAYKGTDERSGDDDKTVTTMDLHAYLSDLVDSQVDEDMAMEIIQEGGDVQFTVTELLKRVAGVRCRIKLIAVIERIGEIAPLKDDKGLPAKSE